MLKYEDCLGDNVAILSILCRSGLHRTSVGGGNQTLPLFATPASE